MIGEPLLGVAEKLDTLDASSLKSTGIDVTSRLPDGTAGLGLSRGAPVELNGVLARLEVSLNCRGKLDTPRGALAGAPAGVLARLDVSLSTIGNPDTPGGGLGVVAGVPAGMPAGVLARLEVSLIATGKLKTPGGVP